jgi:hypothetical protein
MHSVPSLSYRCTNPGSAFMVDNQILTVGYHEAYICSDGRALIEAGAPWDVQEC